MTLLSSLRDCFRARAVLQAEILALRHQLLVLQRSNRNDKLRLRWADRALWVRLSRFWNDWRSALLLVKPETIIAWHRKRFRLYWRCKSLLAWERMKGLVHEVQRDDRDAHAVEETFQAKTVRLQLSKDEDSAPIFTGSLWAVLPGRTAIAGEPGE